MSTDGIIVVYSDFSGKIWCNNGDFVFDKVKYITKSRNTVLYHRSLLKFK